LLAVIGCLSPTEVTLVLTTDVSCGMLKDTTIAIGKESDIETKPQATTTTQCDLSGNIGTFVVVPSSAKNETFAVRIVAGVDRSAEYCGPANNSDYQGCIVARRELSFVPHTPLMLPIAMREQCKSVTCPSVNGKPQTCVVVHGTAECVSGLIPNPASCMGSTCAEGVLVDGGGEDAPASPGDGSPVSNDGPADSPGNVGPDVMQSDGHVSDATVPDASRPDVYNPPDATQPDAQSNDAQPNDGPTDAPPPPTDSTGGGNDAAVLGSCVGAGTSPGVSCGPVTCGSGQACCVGVPAGGGSPSLTCMTTGQCGTVNPVAGTTYSELACRNRGDCPSGTVCCLVPGSASTAHSASCKATCPSTFSQTQACRNTCECPTSTCMVAGTGCAPLSIATCGGACI
jgi:hypothetical protein